jgi:hypothetical protein
MGAKKKPPLSNDRILTTIVGALVRRIMDYSLTAAEKVVATVLAYYRQTDLLRPTASELLFWLDSCAPKVQAELLLLEQESLLLLPPFKRYLLEKHGYSMAAYMATHLSETELAYWVERDKQLQEQ